MAETPETRCALIADDDTLARRVLRDVLSAAGFVVVAEAIDGEEAVRLAGLHRPDVILMDVVMPGLGGIEATRQVTERWPETVVVLLTGGRDEDAGLRGLRAGAAGYLSKDVELEALPRAIRAALAGQAAISRALAMRLVEDLRRDTAHVRPIHSSLTAREWEVLDLICEGLTNEEIANAFVVSTETVRTHVKSILRKLGVHSRQEAASIAGTLRASSP